jgi:RNA polymerase sigma-70 factor (ECF subfamily)
MMNGVIYRSRKKKNHRSVALEEIEDSVQSLDASAAEQMESAEMTRLIEEAIETLPPKQKGVFMLRFYDEMQYEDISVILGTSVGGLKANYFHAAKKIAEYVQKKGRTSPEAIKV